MKDKEFRRFGDLQVAVVENTPMEAKDQAGIESHLKAFPAPLSASNVFDIVWVLRDKNNAKMSDFEKHRKR